MAQVGGILLAVPVLCTGCCISMVNIKQQRVTAILFVYISERVPLDSMALLYNYHTSVITLYHITSVVLFSAVG